MESKNTTIMIVRNGIVLGEVLVENWGAYKYIDYIEVDSDNIVSLDSIAYGPEMLFEFQTLADKVTRG